MNTTDRNRLYAQTASQMLQLRDGCWYIVDDARIITLGAMSIPQAAMKLRDYKSTWTD